MLWPINGESSTVSLYWAALPPPVLQGLSRVVNFLLHKKQGYGEVVIVNLRNDMVIEFDEATYHVQDTGFLGEPVQVYGASGKDMEVSAQWCTQ